MSAGGTVVHSPAGARRHVAGGGRQAVPVSAFDPSDRPRGREAAGDVADRVEPPGRVARAAAWLQATPAELVGLAVLLLGALAATLLLWGGAVDRPAELPSPMAASEGEAVAGPEAVGRPAGAAEAWDDATTDPAADAGPADAPGSGAAGGPVTVHVSGAVAWPGLVTVPAGGRVGDAVAAAGGLLAAADVAAVNLARPLVDGEQVHVPAQGEHPPTGPEGGPATQGPDAGDGAAGSGGVDADGRVDLNRATEQELQTLPGVGPARATAIVEHRETHGPFASPGDLRAVPGIGEKTFQNLADRVVVR